MAALQSPRFANVKLTRHIDNRDTPHLQSVFRLDDGVTHFDLGAADILRLQALIDDLIVVADEHGASEEIAA